MAEFKPFAAREPLKKVTADYFQDLGEAARDPARKVAWCTSIGPAELLRGLGFEVFFPENHGALLGATRKANHYIPAPRQRVQPRRVQLSHRRRGAFLDGETPLTKAYGFEAVPRPDVLVFNTNQCRDVQDWFAFYARRFGVPFVGVHSPDRVGEVTDEIVAA